MVSLTAEPFQLSTIGGGINRLRTKGGADKTSLWDLLNGYVTQANTVKVRPGTFRQANIAQYSGAGTTKGLMAYQGDFHVFSSSVVDVPPGYALHVLSHPAGGQYQTSGETGLAYAGTTTSAANAEGPFAGEWERAFVGYVNDNPGGTQFLGDLCSNTGGNTQTLPISNQDIVNNLVSLGQTTGFNSGIILVMRAGFVTGDFTLTLNLVGGEGTHTYSSTSADVSPGGGTDPGAPPQGSESGMNYWIWHQDTPADFQVSSFTQWTFQQTPTVEYVPIPIKEINFSAPYLGGIYVVATFEPNSTVLGDLGDTFHYWIQSSTASDTSNVWSPNTDYQIGDVVIPETPNGFTYIAQRLKPPNPLWTASTPETVGNIVEPNVANGFFYTVTNTEGATPTTGTTEPTWPTSDGGIVVEQSSLANDQSISLATAATTPAPTIPARYSVSMAGGFTSPESGPGVSI